MGAALGTAAGEETFSATQSGALSSARCPGTRVDLTYDQVNSSGKTLNDLVGALFW